MTMNPSDEMIEMKSDEINRRIENAVAELQILLDDEAEYIRPYEAKMVLSLFVPYFRLAESLDEIEPEGFREEFDKFDVDAWGAFVRLLSDQAIGNLMLQFPIVDCPVNADPNAPVEKHLGVEVAKALGPDWAQAWYHFIVFVTKVA